MLVDVIRDCPPPTTTTTGSSRPTTDSTRLSLIGTDVNFFRPAKPLSALATVVAPLLAISALLVNGGPASATPGSPVGTVLEAVGATAPSSTPSPLSSSPGSSPLGPLAFTGIRAFDIILAAIVLSILGIALLLIGSHRRDRRDRARVSAY